MEPTSGIENVYSFWNTEACDTHVDYNCLIYILLGLEVGYQVYLDGRPT